MNSDSLASLTERYLGYALRTVTTGDAPLRERRSSSCDRSPVRCVTQLAGRARLPMPSFSLLPEDRVFAYDRRCVLTTPSWPAG